MENLYAHKTKTLDTMPVKRKHSRPPKPKPEIPISKTRTPTAADRLQLHVPPVQTAIQRMSEKHPDFEIEPVNTIRPPEIKYTQTPQALVPIDTPLSIIHP